MYIYLAFGEFFHKSSFELFCHFFREIFHIRNYSCITSSEVVYQIVCFVYWSEIICAYRIVFLDLIDLILKIYSSKSLSRFTITDKCNTSCSSLSIRSLEKCIELFFGECKRKRNICAISYCLSRFDDSSRCSMSSFRIFGSSQLPSDGSFPCHYHLILI